MSCCAPAPNSTCDGRLGRDREESCCWRAGRRRRLAADRSLGARQSIAAAASRRSSGAGRLPASSMRASISRPSASTIHWRGDAPPPFIAALNGDRLRRPSLRCRHVDARTIRCRELMRALAVAGFAAEQHHAAVGRRSGRARKPQRAISSTGSRRRSRCRRSPIPDACSSVRPGSACATAGPTWTCRSRSACCSPSA